VAGALHRPNVITRDSKRPMGVLKAILCSLPLCMRTLLYPYRMSSLVKNRAPKSLSTNSGMSGMGAAFFLVIAFRG